MYYLITEERVYMAKELADFDKFGYSVDYDEITSMVGSDRIIDIRGEEYITNKAFLRDKNKIKNAVMMSALYGAPETNINDSIRTNHRGNFIIINRITKLIKIG